MTKEQILEKHMGLRAFANDIIVKDVTDSMDEYAKQECIAYQKFLFHTNIEYEDLYFKYLQSKEKK